MSVRTNKLADIWIPAAEEAADTAGEPGKKPYSKPQLTCFGRLDEKDPRRIAFGDVDR